MRRSLSLAVRRRPADRAASPRVLAVLNHYESVAGGGPKSSPRMRCAEVNCVQSVRSLLTMDGSRSLWRERVGAPQDWAQATHRRRAR